jgi:SAM-dependent methyltransferase
MYREARTDLVRSNTLKKGIVEGTSRDVIGDALRSESLRAHAGELASAAQRKTQPTHDGSARYARLASEHAPDVGADALLVSRMPADRWRPSTARYPGEPRVKIGASFLGMHAEWAARDRETARAGKAFAAAPGSDGRGSMIRTRGFATVSQLLGHRFEKQLAEMGPDDTWIDVGTGQGGAPLGFLRERADLKPRVVGVDLHGDAAKAAEKIPGGRFTVLEGDVTKLALPQKVGLITDVMGAMSYTDRPDLVMRAYADALRPGGRLMMILGFHETNTVLDKDGRSSEMLADYLGRVPGFEVESMVPLNVGTVVNLRRTDAKAVIPSLEMLHAEDHGPPHRVFRVTEGAGPGTVKGPGAFERFKAPPGTTSW